MDVAFKNIAMILKKDDASLKIRNNCSACRSGWTNVMWKWIETECKIMWTLFNDDMYASRRMLWYNEFFMPLKCQSSAFLITDRYWHNKTYNYTIGTRDERQRK